MYGWRARIGSITPNPSEHFTYEFYKLAPPGVVCIPTCLWALTGEREELRKEREGLMRVVEGLAKAEVDYIIVGGAPMVYLAGMGEDKRLLAEIKRITPIPATTDITCTMEAFDRLGVKKITIATPLTTEVNRVLKAYLENEGYQVLAIKNLEMKGSIVNILRLPLETSYKLAREAYRAAPDAEAIYLPVAVWSTLENIDAMEQDFGIPVVTNFVSKYWAAMETLKIRQTIKGYGKLLETLA